VISSCQDLLVMDLVLKVSLLATTTVAATDMAGDGVALGGRSELTR
jgi:hypothetical protein